MPRKPRQPSPTGVYHFINRGVNRKPLFHNSSDYRHYQDLLKEYSSKLGLHIFHYCLMTNHTHLLLRSSDVSVLSQFGHFIQRRYAYYYCKTYKWPEQVFRKRFLSLPVDDDAYLLECGRYIERNPLKARLVSDPKDYAYSSYPFYAYNKPDYLLIPSPAYEALAPDENTRATIYRHYVKQPREQEKEMSLDKV